MDPIPSPHDRFFRESFGRIGIARDFLRHHLPQDMLAETDLQTLRIAKDSYVTKELHTSYSDLVYRVNWRDGQLHVYLLFEHKSRPEWWTALQVLRYIVLGAEQYRKQHPGASHLPPVYPLVLYHGTARWRAPRDFHELVAPLSPTMLPYVPQFRYALHDISPRSDTQIRGEVLTRLAQLAMRYIHDGEPRERLRELLDLIGQVIERDRSALEILEALLRYYVQGTGRLDEAEVRELLASRPEGEDIMQTFIDKYIEEGERKGRREGRVEGQARVLLRQIELKFGAPAEEVRRRVETADADTLLRWSERVLTARSLQDVFG